MKANICNTLLYFLKCSSYKFKKECVSVYMWELKKKNKNKEKNLSNIRISGSPLYLIQLNEK